MSNISGNLISPTHHSVIILAGGLSSRLGQPKQLLKKQSLTLLEWTVEIALATKPKPQYIVLVVPQDSVHVMSIAKQLASQHPQVETVYNDTPQVGMSRSLSLAIDALKSSLDLGLDLDNQGVLILGVDQVLLTTSHLQCLLDKFYKADQHKKPAIRVIASKYLNKQDSLENNHTNSNIKSTGETVIGLPILIAFELLKMWQPQLSGDKGLRRFIRQLPLSKVAVIWQPSLSFDIDTPEQLGYAQRQGWLDSIHKKVFIKKVVKD